MRIYKKINKEKANNIDKTDNDFQKRIKENFLVIEDENEHQNKLVERKIIKRKKHKYDTKISKELLSTLATGENNSCFTIDKLLGLLNISVKNYYKLFQDLAECKSKHIYNELSNTSLNLLLKIIYQLHKLSFSSEQIKYFLGATLTKDTIIKYIRIETVRRNKNILKQKEYIIHFIDKSSGNTLEDIKKREFLILKKIETKRRSNGISYKLIYIDSEFLLNNRSKEIEIMSEIEISSIKKSRIYKKILIN